MRESQVCVHKPAAKVDIEDSLQHLVHHQGHAKLGRAPTQSAKNMKRLKRFFTKIRKASRLFFTLTTNTPIRPRQDETNAYAGVAMASTTLNWFIRE